MSLKNRVMISMVKGLTRRESTKSESGVREIKVDLFLSAEDITNRCQRICSQVGEIATAYTG